jgi:hypothetical protein
MRGKDKQSRSLFRNMDLEARVGRDHTHRAIRVIVKESPDGECAFNNVLADEAIRLAKQLRAILLLLCSCSAKP